MLKIQGWEFRDGLPFHPKLCSIGLESNLCSCSDMLLIRIMLNTCRSSAEASHSPLSLFLFSREELSRRRLRLQPFFREDPDIVSSAAPTEILRFCRHLNFSTMRARVYRSTLFRLAENEVFSIPTSVFQKKGQSWASIVVQDWRK